MCTRDFANVTLDAQGTASSSNPQRLDITSGTFQATHNSSTGQTLYSGNINGGNFNNNISGWSLSIGREVHRVSDKAHNCARLDDILAMTTCASSVILLIEYVGPRDLATFSEK